VTTVACLAGVIAALASASIVGTDAAAAANQRTVVFMSVAIVAQFPVFRVIGIDVTDFGIKDYLYVGFMTFALWFITFSILLTEQVAV
jgi:hypothetical protein